MDTYFLNSIKLKTVSAITAVCSKMFKKKKKMLNRMHTRASHIFENIFVIHGSLKIPKWIKKITC